MPIQAQVGTIADESTAICSWVPTRWLRSIHQLVAQVRQKARTQSQAQGRKFPGKGQNAMNKERISWKQWMIWIKRHSLNRKGSCTWLNLKACQYAQPQFRCYVFLHQQPEHYSYKRSTYSFHLSLFHISISH